MERQQITRTRAALEHELTNLNSQLEQLDRSCNDGNGHVWGDVRFNPIHRKGYTIPSDVEMGIELGVDTRRSSIHVPSETIKQWTRTCNKCAFDEHTTRTKKVSKPGSIPGTSAEEEIPVFR